MTAVSLRSTLRIAWAIGLLAAYGLDAAAPARGQTGWAGYGGNMAHTAKAPASLQVTNHIRWSTPVDQAPQYSGGELLIHYGCPAVTAGNTVLVPVKTQAAGSFQVEAHRGFNGFKMWTLTSNYVLPPHDWTPSFGIVQTANGPLAMPDLGGQVTFRDNVDRPTGNAYSYAFYGTHTSSFDGSVFISTPITSDESGNVYFGFVTNGAAPAPLVGVNGGLARIDANGNGTWVNAAKIVAGDTLGITKVAFNCAPAISNDGSVVYVAINNGNGSSSVYGAGYLVGLNSTTLATKYAVKLFDYQNAGNLAIVTDDSTASPCVGPDGDVYFGVLENPFYSNHLRGWMLHFDSTLTTSKIAGGFGWDDTASIVPAAALGANYTGGSSYLILTKYNNYVEGNGDGYNRVAILDPNAAETVTVAGTKPVTNTNVMKEVISLPGQTIDTRFNNPAANPNPYPNAVREWCVNSVVVDGSNKCAAVNSEDGSLYRWDFTTNSTTAKLVFNNGVGEAYTPTFVGPDGQVYAINNAVLFACEAAQRPR